ncbi:MAG: hypothetical protein Q8O95_06070 [bacterium]|nr:hypothetical protein [bacterium]
MNALKNLFGQKKSDDILVVGGDGGTFAEDDKKPVSQYFYYLNLLFLVGMLFFSYLFTGNLISEKQVKLRSYYQILQQKEVAEKDLNSLKNLSVKVSTIKEDQALVTQAIPADSRYDQVMAYLESLFDQIRRRNFIQIPETISWRQVSHSDISNDDLLSLDVYEYSVEFLGDYEALVKLLEELRSSLRLFDVRSIRSLKVDEGGMVGADIVFWAYSLPVL